MRKETYKYAIRFREQTTRWFQRFEGDGSPRWWFADKEGDATGAYPHDDEGLAARARDLIVLATEGVVQCADLEIRRVKWTLEDCGGV